MRTTRFGATVLATVALVAVGCSSGADVAGQPLATTAPVTAAPATPDAPVSTAPATATPDAPVSTAPATATPDAAVSTAPATRSVAPATSTSSPFCASAELKVTLGQAEGAAGSVYRTLVFTNTGSRTCVLRGFPGVSYVAGADGHQVGPAAEMSGKRGGDVRLGEGAAAAAQLQLVNVQNFDPNVCRPTPVRGLRVYPPGETASVFVPMDGTGCAGTPPGPQLTVQTITAR